MLVYFNSKSIRQDQKGILLTLPLVNVQKYPQILKFRISNLMAHSIPARSHTFLAIDHEIISTVILLPSAESFKKGCCQLQAKVCA